MNIQRKTRLTKRIVIIDHMIQLKNNFNLVKKRVNMSHIYFNVDNYSLNCKITNFQKNDILLFIIQTKNYHYFGGIPPFNLYIS